MLSKSVKNPTQFNENRISCKHLEYHCSNKPISGCFM